MRNASGLVVAALLGLVVACSDGLGPRPSGDSANIELGISDPGRHEQLKQLLAAEKERIKRERENGKLAFEIARAEWRLYRDQLKKAKKLGSAATELLRCEPRVLEGDAAIIGPQGGTLHIGDHELVIPRGALSEEQLIVGEAPTSSLVDVEFEPEGLQFLKPVQLTLSYKGCLVPPGNLLVAYLGTGNRILELPASTDYRSYSEVIAEIHHFSRYAVAY
jgi:hypothetical protein